MTYIDVEVHHNGNDISTEVVSYSIQKKICTGIGSLEIEVVTGGSYDPWDIIEVWEYGYKKGKFFISKTLDTLETGVTTLSCLDNVKRLQDYFIVESYLVDYPSTCKYWIEKFLAEAGVEYEFTVEDSGSLLSNNTSLGVASAYEQITTLLQMSGWYIYFDGDGVAIIGKLSTEIGDITESYSKSDIIDIKVVTNDNMLRNRVVVWGNQDPITQQWVFADVSHPTPWDYDSDDKRTILISNSNIPNIPSAYNLANIAINEFARITVEKHLDLAVGVDVELGDFVFVESDVYTGSGMVTTIGSMMSKQGLVPSFILDERCPRLFGFFDYGDYVYIGTDGDGVWRKHFKWSTTWANYSAGLLNKNISDLHINNGVASLVTVSGDLYQSKLINNYWTKVPIGNLESFIEDNPEEVEDYTVVTFSGVQGRATILDKTSNMIRYAVDTYSGCNWTDYEELISGFTMASGGDIVSSGNRSWILDKNPALSTFNNYPINISGDYNVRVIDLENDGINDYVSVIGSGWEVLISGNSYGYNFKRNIAGLGTDTQTLVCLDYVATYSPIEFNYPASFIYDNESIGEHEIITGGGNYIIRDAKTGAVIHTIAGGLTAILAKKISPTIYNIYGITGLDYARDVWDTDANTVTRTTYSPPPLAYQGVNLDVSWNGCVPIDGVLYILEPCQSDHYRCCLVWALDENGLELDGAAYEYVADWFENWEGELLQESIWIGRGGWGGWMELSYIVSLGTTWAVFDEFRTEFVYKPSIYNPWGWSDPIIYRKFFMATKVGYFLLFEENDWHQNHRFISEYTALTTYRNALYEATLQHISWPEWEYTFSYYYSTGSSSYEGLPPFYSKVPEGANFQIFPTTAKVSAYYHTCVLMVTQGEEDPKFYYLDGPTLMAGNEIILSHGFGEITYKPLFMWPVCDARNYYNYWAVLNNLDNKAYLTYLSPHGSTIYRIFGELPHGNSVGMMGRNCGKIFGYGSYYTYFDAPFSGNIYTSQCYVLQRTGNDFAVVDTSSKPIRLDISSYAPLIDVQDVESTFKSFFINGSGAIVLGMETTLEGMQREVNDFRYCYFPVSGASIGKDVLYTNEANIYKFSIETMSDPEIYYTISGHSVDKLETTNFVPSGQYIFVSTSGDASSFYQKNPESPSFVNYDTGLPDSRITIIRVDDRL